MFEITEQKIIWITGKQRKEELNYIISETKISATSGNAGNLDFILKNTFLSFSKAGAAALEKSKWHEK